MHPEFLAQATDEIIESIWRRHEAGEDTSLAGLLATVAGEAGEELLRRMAAEGLVRLEEESVMLTEAGEKRARTIVRCHRLAERLLHDVLSLPARESEETACLMEHVLSPAVADAVCAFLGHPPTCPHGQEIPAGECCAARDREVRPVVVPLADLEPGRSARIVFMAPSFHRRVDKLGSFGIVPGSVIRLRQKRPSFVIELEGTSLAIDAEVAREIYVRRVS